jgi:hypothetical protein
MEERSLCMREVPGSIPGVSNCQYGRVGILMFRTMKSGGFGAFDP